MRFGNSVAQLEFLAWRDAQMTAISEQLEAAFPSLLLKLKEHAESAGRMDLAWSSVSLRGAVEDLIRGWASEQLKVALSRAEAELDQALLELPSQMNIEGDVWEQLSSAAPAIAGVGLIAASPAAIPTVVSFATVGTSIFAFWGTAAISWPLFAVGAAGIGIAALTGSQSLRLAEENARASLANRLQVEAARQVFGIGEPIGCRSILSDIQAAVIQAGQNRISGAVV